MEILVTGHKGFIGTEVYAKLKADGYNVTGMDIGDRLPDTKFDYIIHLGARTLIRKSKELPYEYFEDNVGLTMRMLEVARKRGSAIVYATSGSVSEATNPYSLGKKQSAEWIELYQKLYNIRRYTLKFYNVYGPTCRKGAVYLFCNAVLKSLPVTVYGDGSHIRDFIHVKDIVKVIERIVDGKVAEGVHEIGTGKGTSVMELIKNIEKKTGKKLQITHADYVLSEADALFAKSPLLDTTIDLDSGIDEVLAALKKRQD
jgi:nucleoside-diphosphate-sugar epimerase